MDGTLASLQYLLIILLLLLPKGCKSISVTVQFRCTLDELLQHQQSPLWQINGTCCYNHRTLPNGHRYLNRRLAVSDVNAEYTLHTYQCHLRRYGTEYTLYVQTAPAATTAICLEAEPSLINVRVVADISNTSIDLFTGTLDATCLCFDPVLFCNDLRNGDSGDMPVDCRSLHLVIEVMANNSDVSSEPIDSSIGISDCGMNKTESTGFTSTTVPSSVTTPSAVTTNFDSANPGTSEVPISAITGAIGGALGIAGIVLAIQCIIYCWKRKTTPPTTTEEQKMDKITKM